jgi:hypothetical protein
MGIAELTTLTLLMADSTKLAGWLTPWCTLSHCGARGVRALSMFIDKMRAPLQLGWSPSLQKEGQLSTNSIFCEGQKIVFSQRLSCETAVECITPPNWEGARDNYSRCRWIFLADLHIEAMLRLVTSDSFILTSLVLTWITISLYSLHSPVLVLAKAIFRLAFTSVALPPGKQCMIAEWLFLSLILRVMESPMTPIFIFSELMVGGFGGSDPVTGGGETWEASSSDSDSLLNGVRLLNLNFLQEAMRKLSGCRDCIRR